MYIQCIYTYIHIHNIYIYTTHDIQPAPHGTKEVHSAGPSEISALEAQRPLGKAWAKQALNLVVEYIKTYIIYL